MKYLILGLLMLTSVHAADLIMPIKGVYDGDTFYSELCALPKPLKDVSIRISGMDTPEIRTTCLSEKAKGFEAKAFLEKLFSGQTEVLVKNADWDKYGGRVNGEVYLLDGTNIAVKMIESGLAVPYSGGKRQSWCN